MCIYVPRAPRPAETPEVMERLHGVQALFKDGGGGRRRRLRAKCAGRVRRRAQRDDGAAQHDPLQAGQAAQQRSRETTSTARECARKADSAAQQRPRKADSEKQQPRRASSGTAAQRPHKTARALRRKLAPACLVCVDITILVAVLCALYAPDTPPAQLLSWFAAGR